MLSIGSRITVVAALALALVSAPPALASSGAPPSSGQSAQTAAVNSPGDLHLVGDARLVNGGRLRLVRHLPSNVGAAWTVQPVAVDGMKVHIAFGINGLCGDGMALVIQNDGPDAIGGNGGDLGYGRFAPHGTPAGITHSLAVELDTYQNDWDPPSPHLSLQTRGAFQNDAHGQYSLTSKSISLPMDGSRQTATMSYHDGLLNVWFDDHILVSRHIDLPNRLGLTEGTAFVGLTASNGACRAAVTIDRFVLTAN